MSSKVLRRIELASYVVGGLAVCLLLVAFGPWLLLTYGPKLHAALDPVFDVVGLIYGVGWLIGLALGFYFLPTIIALSLQRRQWLAIVAVNLLLGWTVLGWIGALVWSLIVDRPAAYRAS